MHVKNYQQDFLKEAVVCIENSGELFKFLHPKGISQSEEFFCFGFSFFFNGSNSLTSRIKLDLVEGKKYPRTQQTRCQGAARTSSSLKDREQETKGDNPFQHCSIHPTTPRTCFEVNKTGPEIMVRCKQESRSSGKLSVKSAWKSGTRSSPVTAGQVHHDRAGPRLSWKIRLQIRTIHGQA